MTVEEVLSHFPSEIPAEICHEANMKRPIYLFRLNKEGNTVCGNCGSKFRGGAYHGHGRSGECPCCRAQPITVYMPNYHNMEAKNLRRTWLTYHWAVSVKNPDVLTCTVILSCYWFSSENPWESEPYRYVDARYIFIPGKGGYCISRKTKFCGGDFLAGIYLEKWEPAPHKQCFILRKRCRDRVRVYANNAIFAGRTDEAQIASAVKGHKLQYVYESMKENLTDDYSSISPIEMMHVMAKYPLQVEYLAKTGFGNMLVEASRYNLGLNHAFNMRGRTLKEITRRTLSKEDMAYIQNNTVSLLAIQRYQEIKKNPMSRGLSLKMAISSLCVAPVDNILYIMNYVRLVKAMRYLQKEKSSIGIYADYLRDCEALGMNLKEKSTLFPKNLQRLHVHMQEQIKRKRDEEAQQKWLGRRNAIADKYAFEYGSFAIVVPENINDLIREGKDMHNCVGGYIKRVADGDTDVVYIRNIHEMDKSLGTMEIHNNLIVQARGKYNLELPDDVQKFVDRFRTEVLEKKGTRTA